MNVRPPGSTDRCFLTKALSSSSRSTKIMKSNIGCGLFVVLVLAVSNAHAQEFTLTTTKANVVSNRASIDMPGLSGNPLAIIVATPLGDTELLNPNPIGAWYYAERWNINNTNGAVMPVGAKYKIQFFLRPGPHQFLHTVTQQNLGGEGSYVDHPALNNNPSARVQILQNHAPDVRSPYNVNRFKARAGYSSAAGRWYISNVGGEPLGRSSAYNVVVAGGGGDAGANQNAASVNGATAGESCTCTSLPPNGNAGGDLSGDYPAPTVQKLSGRPLSNAAPDTGQVLKWNGTGWAPAADSVGAAAGNGPTYTGGLGIELEGNSFNALSTTAMWNASKLAGRDILTTAPTVGQVLKWGGGAWLPGDDNVGGGAAAPPSRPTSRIRSNIPPR
jgi:hypothetical protein